MRLLPLLLGLLLSGGVIAAPAPAPVVTLAGTGISLGTSKPTRAAFGLPRAATLKIAEATLGTPVKTGTYPDCGQGAPMGYARYKGGLELVFLKGKFSGWTLAEHGTMAWHSVRGIGVGATRAALYKAYPTVSIEDSSLGVMFTTDDEISGFLAGKRPTAKVLSMYAGETCMIS